MKSKFLLIVSGSKPYLSLEVELSKALESIFRAYGVSQGEPREFALPLVNDAIFTPIQPFSLGENIRNYDMNSEYIVIHFNYGGKLLYFTYKGKTFNIDLRNRLVFVNYLGNNLTVIINKIDSYNNLFTFINRIIGTQVVKQETKEESSKKNIYTNTFVSDVVVLPKTETTNLIINNNDIEIKGTKRVASNKQFNNEMKAYLETVEVENVDMESGQEELSQ